MPGIVGVATQTLEQVLGFGVGQGLYSVLAPESTALAQESWSKQTTLALDAQTAALLVRLGILTEDQGASEAAQTGINPVRFAQLVRGARTPPGASELIELVRRGFLDANGLSVALQQAGMDPRFTDAYAKLRTAVLSPEDAAMARQQGFLSEAEAKATAALSGVADSEAEIQFEMAGLPPGISEGIELLRRGEITEDYFAQIVREGHTKTKYVQDLLKLRWQPLTAALAAEALVRERVDKPRAQAIAAENGIRPDDFDLYVNLLGRPMGIGQALTLYRRGQMDKAGFREVVARSDVRTEYTDNLLELATVYPPLFQLSRLITSGAVDDKYAKEILTKEGYPEKLIDGIIANAHHTKTVGTKHVALSVIETLYEAGLTSHEQSEKAIEVLKYTQEEADELLQMYDARRIVQEIARAITILRNHYTSWKIDAVEVHTKLSTLLSDPATVDRLLSFWKTERDANAPVLSTPQIVAAFHWDRYTYDQATQLLLTRGWSADDALTLLWSREHGDPRVPKA